MAPLAVAMGLAQFAPQIIRWITGSDKAEQAATQVVAIAQAITGRDQGETALSAIQADPALALQFRQSVLENEAALDKAYLADVQSARERDVNLAKAIGARNWRPDVMFVLAVAVIAGLVWMIWSSADISEYVKGIFTLVLGRFLGYLDSIYNFEFGSTRSSKVKDATINDLSKR